MNILLIHHRLPYPLNSGMDKVRYNLIRSLSTGHKVTLIAPVDEFTRTDSIEDVRSICHKLIAVPVKNRSSAVRQSSVLYLRRLARLVLFREPIYVFDHEYSDVALKLREYSQTGRYDIVQASSNITAGYLKYVREFLPHILGPMDDAAESIRSSMEVARPKGFKHLMWKLRYNASLYYDIRACKNSDWVFFHSVEDMRNVSNFAGGLPQARVLPISVEVDDEPRPSLRHPETIQEPGSIIFVGGLGSYFNTDAVLYFFYQIFPLILRDIPDASFYVVGQHPPRKVKSLEQEGNVIVTGSVSDVRPYIEKAAVYVAPVRAGTGYKTKIVEALALGKAIVSTAKGVQGLWDRGDDIISIEDDPEAFARKVIYLLQNDNERYASGKNARNLFEKSYTFKAVTPKILELYDEVEKKLR